MRTVHTIRACFRMDMFFTGILLSIESRPFSQLAHI